MIKTFIASILSVCAFIALAQPASAASWSDQRSVRISTAQYDLTDEAGAAVMYRRLRSAARIVCGSADHRRVSLSERAAFGICFNETLEEAVATLDAPLVSARHEEGRARVIVASR